MSTSKNKPNISFWIISTLALIWNLVGANQYLQQAYNTESFRAMYTEEEFALIQATPSWAIAAFALQFLVGLPVVSFYLCVKD